MSKFKTLYEDEHLLAVSKPRGLLTVASKPRQPNLLEYIQSRYSKENIRLRPLHRLDKDTSGVILFCKTKECFIEAIVNKKFKDSKKTYLAVVTGIPKFKTGKITFPLPSRENKRILLPCTTKYKVIKEYRSGQVTAALVEAVISSGKFHQIREHMKMIRHPLLMDREYMDRQEYKRYQKMVSLRHYLLHAYKIEFIHFVTNESLEIICKIPEEVKKMFKITEDL